MRTQGKLIRSSVLVALCWACGGTAADVVVDRTGGANGFSPIGWSTAANAQKFVSSVSVERWAIEFQTPADTWHLLDSVTIPLTQEVDGVGGNYLRVRLAADQGGLPGETIEVLSENMPVPTHPPAGSTTPVPPMIYSSALRPILRPGEKYWLVTELTAVPSITGMSGKYWIRVLLNDQNMNSRTLRHSAVNMLPADPWVGSTFELNWPVAFRIEGTPIAERACCNPRTGACRAVLPSVCTALGLTVVSGSVVCGPAACPPACPGDFNASGGTTVQDIFDYLAAYFVGC